MKALILAAGYATRLYPLTESYPKPLLEVSGRPLINYIIDKLNKLNSISEIIVVTNSKFIGKFKVWRKGIKINKPLSLVDDLTKGPFRRLGAVGDINFVLKKKRLQDNLLVVGGDNLFDAGLEGFLSFARRKNPHPIIGAYQLKKRSEAKRYGVVKLDKNKRIIDFTEKPLYPRSKLAAMCLYYFPKTKLKLISEYLASRRGKYDATGFYIDWLSKKEPVYAFVFGGKWYDIGDYAVYHRVKYNF